MNSSDSCLLSQVPRSFPTQTNKSSSPLLLSCTFSFTSPGYDTVGKSVRLKKKKNSHTRVQVEAYEREDIEVELVEMTFWLINRTKTKIKTERKRGKVLEYETFLSIFFF